MMQWIKVEDSLPEKYGEVLLYYDSRIHLILFLGKVFNRYRSTLMEITEEQFKQYINKNWDNCFVLGMAKFVRDAMFSKQTDEDMEDYRQELKDLIFEAISDGVKAYLEQYDAEAMRIIDSSLSNALKDKKITVRID